MKFCPKCATGNADDASICKNAACGHRFATEPPRGETSAPTGEGAISRHSSADVSETRRNAAAASTTGKRYCKKCGTAATPGAESCPRCGAPLPRPAARTPLPPPSKPSPKTNPDSRKTPRPDIGVSCPKRPVRGEDARTAWLRFAKTCAAAAAAAVVVVGGAILFTKSGHSSNPRQLVGNVASSPYAYRLPPGMVPIQPLYRAMYIPNFTQYSPEQQKILSFAMVVGTFYPSRSDAGYQARLDSRYADLSHEIDRALDSARETFGPSYGVYRFGTSPTGETITWDPKAAVQQNIPYVPFTMDTAKFY